MRNDVFWLGGSACAGKTTVARKLSGTYDLLTYHCDDHFHRHKENIDPERHPWFFRIAHRTPEELWLRPAEQQSEELLGFYAEEFDMVVDDLKDLSTRAPVLAEGAGLMPALLTSINADVVSRGVWLVATGDFRRSQYPRRGPWVNQLLAQCRQQEEAWQNWMARDDRFAAQVLAQAEQHHARVLPIDGQRSASEIARIVATHLQLDKRLVAS